MRRPVSDAADAPVYRAIITGELRHRAWDYTTRTYGPETWVPFRDVVGPYTTAAAARGSATRSLRHRTTRDLLVVIEVAAGWAPL